MTRVRVRGIHATALTERLADAFEVVGASEAIDRRFDREFAAADHDVAVTDTDCRRGVGVVGDPEGVAAVGDDLAAVEIDALVHADDAPRGARFDATVTDTRGSGAVLDLGPREGFLPFDAVATHVTEGDEVRVQVHDPAPRWSDRRPVVGDTVRAFGGLADLVRDGGAPSAATGDPEAASDLARMTDLLPVEVPDGWGVQWNYGAAGAGMDALEDALSRAAERARAIDDGADPAEGTAWVRFGREARFALDAIRREVVPTMAGHHRIKAGGEAAGTAVDFVERLRDPPSEFPFGAVVEQFGPAEGDRIAIRHGKPDGRGFPLGEGVVVGRDGRTITVEREIGGGGTYDALGTPKEEGDVATTKLKEGRWWYPTAYRGDDGERKGTYVNVCTPVELFPAAAAYVDLHVDVLEHPDGRVERVDADELDAAVEAGDVPEPLAERARGVAAAVERALR
ncbi:MAG: DUF402 domain-containing protein [Halobacteriales archaeon]